MSDGRTSMGAPGSTGVSQRAMPPKEEKGSLVLLLEPKEAPELV